MYIRSFKGRAVAHILEKLKVGPPEVSVLLAGSFCSQSGGFKVGWARFMGIGKCRVYGFQGGFWLLGWSFFGGFGGVLRDMWLDRLAAKKVRTKGTHGIEEGNRNVYFLCIIGRPVFGVSKHNLCCIERIGTRQQTEMLVHLGDIG